MNSLRREFIKQTGLLGSAFLLVEPMQSLLSFSSRTRELSHLMNEISFIHTNDLHNTIAPMENGYGGMENIYALLARSRNSAVLLDGGDFLDEQLEYDAHCRMIEFMNKIGYKGATIGNREIARGEEYLASLIPQMQFPIVNCNYSFEHSALKQQVRSGYVVRQGKFKIGITGVGINPNKFSSRTSIQWNHPYESANQIAVQLKKEGCDVVVCLSHLGYNANAEPNNLEFARNSQAIDLIISGHGKTLVPGMMVLKNKQKEEVLVSHAGQNGILMKQITFGFDQQLKNNVSYRNIIPGQAEGSSAYVEIKRLTA